MVRKMLRCILFWIPAAGLTVFCIMYWMWSLHNIRLVVSGVSAVARMAAEAVDAEAAGQITEELLSIRRDAPQGAVLDYTADEQVVLLGRYREVEKLQQWQKLKDDLTKISGTYTYAEEFSLVYLDPEAAQLVWIAGTGHPTGYSAWLKDLALPDENGYEVAAFAGHREGTAVLEPLPGQNGDPRLYICGHFSFAGIMGSELKRLLVPLIVIVVFTVLCAARVFFLFWRRRMQEMETENVEAGKEAEENEEDKEKNEA